MKPAPSVCEAVWKADSVETAIETIRTFFSLHHVTCHLGFSNSSIVEAPYVKSTYSSEWLARYLLKRYLLVDPVVLEGFSRRLPFDWTELAVTPEAQALLADARAFDVGTCGYSVPVVDKSNRRSLFSITANMPEEEWRRFTAENGGALVDLEQIVHQKAVIEAFGPEQRFPHLSEREIECLSLIAQGKDSPSIALILGLSENTVRAYLKSIRHKLDCTTMAQAVAKAIRHRVIGS